MPLVDRLPVHNEIVKALPTRLALGDVVIPENVELTFVGGMHDARFSSLDFLDSALADNDILAMEMCGWTDATVKSVRAVAKGSSKDLQKLVTQEQEFAKTRRSGYDTNAGQAAWNAKYYRTIYAAKSLGAVPLRVITPDYPVDHPKITMGLNAKSFGRFSLAISKNLAPQEKDLQILADREMYIARNVCRAIVDIRRTDPRLKNKNPLKIIMPYGTIHYAIAEALDFQAKENGVDSFTTTVLFEPMEKRGDNLTDAMFEIAQSQAHVAIPVYQNWLRAA